MTPTPTPGDRGAPTQPPASTLTVVPALTPDAAYTYYLPLITDAESTPPAVAVAPTQPPVPTLTPTPIWPEPLSRQTASKLSLHVIRNEDPYIMEFVRRIRPRVLKSVDDLGWLAEAKAVSPETVTIGRLNYANVEEHWPDTTDPVAAAHTFVNTHLETYRLNPGVDYWEGWNEFVPVTPARWNWYTQFEATRVCAMQAAGLRAAVGGFAAGTPEYGEMALFLPALEAAHRCGGIFTLHEGVIPVLGCGLVVNQPGLIPGAPPLPVPAGDLMLRYRFWYEGYLKPRGIGDLPLVISELAVGGLVPGSPCNGPGGAAWKLYQDWWVQNGVGPSGPQAYVNLLAWYDEEVRRDPYVWGVTIFTAGAISRDLGWFDYDIHEAIVPLAYYAARQQ